MYRGKNDYDNLIKDTIPEDSYTAYGALINGTAVCSGYAEAAKLLLNAAGIECIIVNGEAGGGRHTWNVEKIGGEYYKLDIT